MKKNNNKNVVKVVKELNGQFIGLKLELSFEKWDEEEELRPTFYISAAISKKIAAEATLFLNNNIGINNAKAIYMCCKKHNSSLNFKKSNSTGNGSPEGLFELMKMLKQLVNNTSRAAFVVQGSDKRRDRVYQKALPKIGFNAGHYHGDPAMVCLTK